MGLLILPYYKCMNKLSEQNPSLLQDKPIRSISDDRYNRGEYVRNLHWACVGSRGRVLFWSAFRVCGGLERLR